MSILEDQIRDASQRISTLENVLAALITRMDDEKRLAPGEAATMLRNLQEQRIEFGDYE